MRGWISWGIRAADAARVGRIGMRARCGEGDFFLFS